MPVKSFRPLTPSTRYITVADYSNITKRKPEKSLVTIRKKTGGRNHYGRLTARGIGGGHAVGPAKAASRSDGATGGSAVSELAGEGGNRLADDPPARVVVGADAENALVLHLPPGQATPR